MDVNELVGKTDQAWRCWGPDIDAHWCERYLNWTPLPLSLKPQKLGKQHCKP
jgi:hypothetical protein